MIYVYNKELTNFKEITHANSVQMSEYYNGIGTIQIYLPIDAYNVSAIENGGIIYDSVRKSSYVIRSHKYDTVKNAILVNGYTCNSLLNNRVIAQKATLNTVEQDVYSVVSDNLRDMPNVRISDPVGFEETCDFVLFGNQLLDSVIPVLEESKIGHRMAWDPDSRNHVFTLYKGNNLTEGIHAVSFSEEMGTAKDLVITLDDSVFSDVIYVQGVLSDDTELVEVVGDPNGEHNEYWMTSSVRQDSKESKEDFVARLRQIGKEEQMKRVKRSTFSVTIDTSEYGKYYNLGDVVSCVSIRFGLTLQSRITGVEYSLDSRNESVNLILGDPVLTVLKEVKINGRY